jgi:small subunit ribosomal protein S15
MYHFANRVFPARFWIRIKRIILLTDPLQNNRKDFNTERSLVMMVGKRKILLSYLKNKDIKRYREIIKKLNLRK